MTCLYRWIVIVVVLLQCVSLGLAQCNFGTERPKPDICPYSDLILSNNGAEEVVVTPPGGGPTYVVSQLRTNATTAVGFCGSYEYPRNDFAFVYDVAGTVGNETHTYIMTIGNAWCTDIYEFTDCLETRPTPFHPPSEVINVRPAVLYNGPPSVPSSYGLPLWDLGGYFYRTITVRVDDTCFDPGTDPLFGIRFEAKPRVFISSVNATITGGFPLALTSSDPVASTNFTRSYVTSRMAHCAGFLLPLQPECTVAHVDCKTSPVARCNDGVRRRPITTYPAPVRLVCRDADYGYIWRIDMPRSTLQTQGLHFDWRIDRPGGSIVDPIGAGAGQVDIPGDVGTRNLIYNDPLENGFWADTTGKHSAEARSTFYIPTWLDAAPSSPLGASRPSTLMLYAGYPDHYVGGTTLGALVQFLDMKALFQMDNLDAGYPLFAYDDVPEPSFPDDFVRQAVLYICETPNLALGASAFATGGSEDWAGFCAAAVLDTTATWEDAFALATTTFAGLNPLDPDPMPTTCECGATPEMICSDDDTPGDPLKFQYDYEQPINTTIDVRFVPVCRMPLPPDSLETVTNLPPNTYFPGPSSPIGTATIPGVSVISYLDDWPEPSVSYVDAGQVVLNYTTTPLGVLWNISNVSPNELASAVQIRLAIANALGGGAPNLAEQTLPYDPVTSNLLIEPLKTRWVISRSLIGQTIFGNINWPCPDDVQSQCPPEADPTFPANTGDLLPAVLASDSFAFISEYQSSLQVAALPLCECYVNTPCANGNLLDETDLYVNVSTLDPPPPGPPPPPSTVPIPVSCIAVLEVCNCIDDNCDGIIDNLPGVGTPCGTNALGQCAMGTLQCIVPPGECGGDPVSLTCVGAVYPTTELCDNADWNCDGIPNNVPGLGESCGSDVGICEKGTLVCDTPTPTPICVGGILPEPFDICGNGLDDNCDGLIDFNCVVLVGPSPSLLPSPSPPPTSQPPLPTPTLPPPSPSPTSGGGDLDLPEFDIPTPNVTLIAVIGAATFTLCCLVGCLYFYICRRRHRSKKRLYDKLPLIF